MKKLILGCCIAATFALLGSIGCADAEYALTDSVQEEGGDDVSAIDEGERQPYFSTAKNLNGSFLS
jgi:hypothetical protein